jgi:hypothetical protein
MGVNALTSDGGWKLSGVDGSKADCYPVAVLRRRVQISLFDSY